MMKNTLKLVLFPILLMILFSAVFLSSACAKETKDIEKAIGPYPVIIKLVEDPGGGFASSENDTYRPIEANFIIENQGTEGHIKFYAQLIGDVKEHVRLVQAFHMEEDATKVINCMWMARGNPRVRAWFE